MDIVRHIVLCIIPVYYYHNLEQKRQKYQVVYIVYKLKENIMKKAAILLLLVIVSVATIIFMVYSRKSQKEDFTINHSKDSILIEEISLQEDIQIDRILVEKSKRLLHVYKDKKLIKTYQIALGSNPVGHKEFEGDGKTPEGIYTINDKNPNSSYYLNLGISYPNERDIQNAKNAGKSPGGDIKIHGLKNGLGFIGKLHREIDWTQGCIAVTNEEMDELYKAVPIGTEIEIRK